MIMITILKIDSCLPEAMAIKLSQSIAEVKGLKKGPKTKAGLCDGVVIAAMRSAVHPPDFDMQSWE